MHNIFPSHKDLYSCPWIYNLTSPWPPMPNTGWFDLGICLLLTVVLLKKITIPLSPKCQCSNDSLRIYGNLLNFWWEKMQTSHGCQIFADRSPRRERKRERRRGSLDSSELMKIITRSAVVTELTQQKHSCHQAYHFARVTANHIIGAGCD